MKTIEEKAKAYDEALGRARELVAKWTGKNKDFYIGDYSYIFPELAESEDERIRRSLVRFLTGMKDISESGRTSCAVRKEDAEMFTVFLKYLEKQKEQKPVDDDNPLNDPRFIDGFDTGREVQKIFDEPTKWSKEDERILKGIIGKIDHDQTYGVSKADMLSFLNRIRTSWKPSEDQMAVLLNAEGLMRANNYKENAKILAELYGELKKL